MSKKHKKPTTRRSDSPLSTSVSSVAEQALNHIAIKNAQSPAPLDEKMLGYLHDASIGRISRSCLEIALQMMSQGIRAEDIADRYVPAVARTLGDEWSDDDLSFSLVSIGSARLQGLLREIGSEWSADTTPNRLVNDSAALVIVTAEAHHTLGSMVLAGQLRRAGLSVQLSVGADPSSIIDIMREGDFSAVLISASIAQAVETVQEMVSVIRSTIVPPPPIVVGGTILDQVADVQGLTGSDLTTNDVSEALVFCDLMSETSASAAFWRIK